METENIPIDEGNGNGSLKNNEKGDEAILLVDDDQMIVTLISMMLQGMGYKLISADTPDAAIRKAAEFKGKIHLLLSDVEMPGMNGKELAAEISRFHPDMKLLLMSGYPADIVSGRGLLDRGGNFLQKPFTNADLSEKVREALSRK